MYKTGDILGGCRLLKECGAGAFGAVFLAENETTGQRVALKILPKTGSRWEKELAALVAYQKKCRHANLMRIYHVGHDDDCVFYTMDAADPLDPDGDYVPDTLGNRLRRRKRLTPEELRPMLDELLNGLEILHRAGLLHRDIKPDNVLFVEKRAVLGDIGLVTDAGNASFAGTRGFISPAVWKGERRYTARDDLYALAVTLYCALTGNEPRGDLELPLSLTFSGCGDLIRAYNAVLDEDSDIHTAADFRTVLLKDRNAKQPERRKWILIACCIISSCIVGYVLFHSFSERKTAAPVRDLPAMPIEPPPAAKKTPSWPFRTPPPKKTPSPQFYMPPPTEQEVAARKSLRLKYDGLVKKLESDQPIAESLRPYLNKMADWYLKRQHDYENTPEPDERTLQDYREFAEYPVKHSPGVGYRRNLQFWIECASGRERDRLREELKKLLEEENRITRERLNERLKLHHARYAAYQKISPCKQAVFDYARRKFRADLLKQELLILPHHRYVPSEMAKLYDEWNAAYRALKPLEKKLLPVFDPAELD